MKLSRVATLLLPTVIFLIASNSSAAYDSDLKKKLANYPNLESDESGEECNTIISVAYGAGNLRERYATADEAKEVIKQAVKSGEVTEAFTKPYLLMFDLVYSPEHAKKSSKKIAEDIEHLCKKPDVRLCDDVINAAVLVSELVEKEKKENNYKADKTVLTREVYKTEGFSSLHFELLEMLFWPEHADKNTEQYADYVANEWCANYTKSERTRMFDKREEELGN